jgi:hypothetical protein
MARVKFDINKVAHETRAKYKRTSISSRKPKKSSMNKAKKRDFKKYNRQGK